MSKPLEVKANLSFRDYRSGKVYQVDLDDQDVLALLGVGYFSPVDEDLEDGDAARSVDAVPEQLGAEGGGDLDAAVHRVHLVGSPESERVGDADVEDRAVSAGSPGKRKSKSVRGGQASDSEGAPGFEGSGSEGDA